MKKAIYILTGVMASGKSTVGEVLALQLEKNPSICEGTSSAE